MIEILCTLTGIIAGIAVVASLMTQKDDRQRFEAQTNDAGPERILGIADQLQVISHRVAADVSAHNEKVVGISDRLKPERPGEIVSTINEIVMANQAMQGQLADAQKRIAQQSRMIEQASKQARTDALTGLSNRRALDEFLANCLMNPDDKDSVGLLLMDIDHFKNFNDSFGHTTGDAVLAAFARAIASCCGEACYSARFGGEEFAVILTAPSDKKMLERAAAIRYYVSEQVISYEDLQLKITASAGLCKLMPEDTSSQVYERADEGLYQSKKAGRNCGHWLGEEGWQPFPVFEGGPKTLSEIEAQHQLEESVRRNGGKVEDDFDFDSSGPSIEEGQSVAAPDSKGLSEMPAKSKNNASEILDLNAFLGRLDAFLSQLRKADLPATAVMVQVLNLGLSPEADSSTWEQMVETVQENLRGIDVVCLYRAHTLCVFMPGCSLDAGVDRAAKLQAALRAAKQDWNDCPAEVRFAVSVAGIGATEDNATFLNRLEAGLEEAQDAAETELVVHTGETCHFQQA